MGFRHIEAMILKEARQITERPRLRQKDIMEWSTSEQIVKDNVTDDEDVVHLPKMKIWCAILKKAAGGK